MTETTTTTDPLVGFGFTLDIPVTEKKKGKATAYPTLPDPTGEMAVIAAEYKLAKESFDTAKGKMERIKPKIMERATPFWFEFCKGLAEPPSSVSINTKEGEVLVTLPDKYGPIQGGAAAVHAIVGPDILKQHFKPTFVVKFDSDSLPETDVTKNLLNEVLAVFKKYDLTSAFEFTPSVKPRKGFSAVRHRILSPEQNKQLDAILPIISMVKTKGRGE